MWILEGAEYTTNNINSTVIFAVIKANISDDLEYGELYHHVNYLKTDKCSFDDQLLALFDKKWQIDDTTGTFLSRNKGTSELLVCHL